MSKSVLVSIIIPIYNRAHLIGETLDSILAQTYDNWECIIVDDGSTDETLAILETYARQDARIEYYLRTDHYLSGGNGARNQGLSLAQGDYVIFFDSDDLMTEDHILVKLETVEKSQSDYVIAKTKFFNTDRSLVHYYTFDRYELTPLNYLLQRLNWLTYDVLLKTSLAQTINFNEQLKSGQEYNYFSKLVFKSTKAFFIDKTLTLRRAHEDSKRAHLKTKKSEIESSLKTRIATFWDIKSLGVERQILREYLFFCIKTAEKDDKIFQKYMFRLTQCLVFEIGIQAMYLPMIYISKKLFKKNNYLRERLKCNLQLAH